MRDVEDVGSVFDWGRDGWDVLFMDGFKGVVWGGVVRCGVVW